MAQAFGQLTAETGAQADTDTNHLSLDGKTLRGSKDADGKAEHVLSAFCVALDQSVGPVSSRGKGMAIPDALRLIDQLDRTDKIVTGDAIFCQKTITSKVVGKGGDDVLPVKDNQKDLRDEIKTAFTEPVFPLVDRRSNLPPPCGCTPSFSSCVDGRASRDDLRGNHWDGSPLLPCREEKHQGDLSCTESEP